MVMNSNARFRRLDLNLLRVFDAVMQERSLTRAAARLALTQPAVSNALRRLREALEDELLVRAGQGLAPTPLALKVWPTVRESLSTLQKTLAPQAFDAATARSTFVLTMADATAAELVPPLVNVLEQQAPGMAVRVVPLSTRDPRRLLEHGDADLALGFFPGVLASLAAQAQSGASPGFAHQRLYDGRYVCVMRKGHPLAAGPLTLEAYCAARHLLVSFSGRPFGIIDEALAALARSRQVVLTVNQFFTAGRVVANSNLLTVLPQHFVPVTGIAQALLQRELPFAVPTVQVDALWHHRLTADPAHAWLRNVLQGVAQRVFGPPSPEEST
jgi:DNA-binding transcriptional LysR family regulator